MPLVEAGVEAAPLCPAPLCDDEAALAGLAAADFPATDDDPEPDPLPDPLPDFPLPLPEPDPLPDPLPDFPLPPPDPDPLSDPLPDFPLPPDLLLPVSDAFVLLLGVATPPDFAFDGIWAG